MTTKSLKEAIKRVRNWPEERQEDAARMLLAMEKQDKAVYRLTDEQVAEVERRLADPDPKFLTPAEVRARLSHRGV